MSERRVRSAGRPVYGRPQPVRGVRRRSWRPRFGLVPRRLSLLVVAVLLVLFALKGLFGISSVKVVSATHNAEITVEAQKSLKGIFQSNLLTFDSGRLESALQQIDPLIKSVTVRRTWPHTITLTVALKQPSLGWSSGNQAYLLDRDGTVISPLPVGSAVPVVADGSNLPVEVGKRVTTSRFVDFTTAIAAGLPAVSLSATGYAVKETTLDLYVTTNKGYQLILDTTRPAQDQLADLTTVLATLAGQHKAPASYIDLRIDGKAYYK